MRDSLASARAMTQFRALANESQRENHPMAALFVPIEKLLLSGGDERLAIAPGERLNAYGCSAYPCPEALAFASSTASTISERAYARAKHARDAVIADALHAGIDEAFDTRIEALRLELKDRLAISDPSVKVVFAPSGTDSQLHAVFAASEVLKGPITTIVVGADQTGSGTAFTSMASHFGARTALGASVQKGERIAGVAGDIACMRVDLCDDRGAPRDSATVDAAVESAVACAVAEGRRVVLMAMDRSKLGWHAPSRHCIETICARWTHNIQVVIDACQARLDNRRISAHLARGHIVLVTGSKFFSGPPFSGAMLVPPRVSAILAKSDPPLGFFDYSTRSDWPRAWQRLRAQLPRQMNYGLWLRWEAALAEMQAYFAVPRAVRRMMLERFYDAARIRIAASPSLELIAPSAPDPSDILTDDEMSVPTIIPFLIRRNEQLLSTAQCAALYAALNRDMTASLPSSASAHDRWYGVQICHIGQPVAISGPGGEATAALRISASARLVSDCWTGDPVSSYANLEQQFENVSIVIGKIETLLRHLPEFDLEKGAS